MKIEPISEPEVIGAHPISQNDGPRPKITPQVLAAIEDSLSAANGGEAGAELSRMPKRISGGLKALEEDLERRADDFAALTRMLHQQRISLDLIEQERSALYEKLVRILPELQDSGRSLRATLDACKSGDVPADIASQFQKNARVLDELEKTAASLSGNLGWLRSVWEQYARTISKAQRQREESRHPA